jgi:hypothetical protein
LTHQATNQLDDTYALQICEVIESLGTKCLVCIAKDAYSLYKRGVTGFSLVISSRAFDIMIAAGSKELQELLDNNLLWQPEDIEEESRESGRDANRAQKSRIRKVNILVMTVLPFTFMLIQVWIPLFPSRQIPIAQRNHPCRRNNP